MTAAGQHTLAQFLAAAFLAVALFAVPIGLLAGVYLEEYAPKNPITSAIEIAAISSSV